MGMFVDVNADGHVTPVDALTVINQLNGEGEGAIAQDLASIAGAVFSDQTENGLTGDDTFVASAVVNLYRDGGNGIFESAGGTSGDDTFVNTDTTDAVGGYRFDGLTVGTYFVEEVVPVSFIARTNGNVQTVIIDATDVQGRVGVSVDDFVPRRIRSQPPTAEHRQHLTHWPPRKRWVANVTCWWSMCRVPLMPSCVLVTSPLR